MFRHAWSIAQRPGRRLAPSIPSRVVLSSRHGTPLPAWRPRLPFRADGFRRLARGRGEARLAQSSGRIPAGKARLFSSPGSSRRCAAPGITAWRTFTRWICARSGLSNRARPVTKRQCTARFWETLHIDLRMVATSDFTIAFVPTNIYSVGTVHEIVRSRLQRKPVLFVSPPVAFPALELLRAHFEQGRDTHALQLLDRLVSEVPIKPNPAAIPNLWLLWELETPRDEAQR